MAATWGGEQIVLRDGLHVDPSKVRRAVDEAAATCFGLHAGGWWRWIVETGHSLGRNCRVIDGEVQQLVRLVRDGVVSPRKIERLLRKDGFEGTLRCVVVESSATFSKSFVAQEGEKKPLQRLLSLLRAESSDVWVIVIFALVSGLLTMTTPLAVEALVNTVAFGRFLQPVIVLSRMLLTFLIFQAGLKAIQTVVVEIIQRRLFARVAAELSFRLPRTRVEALDDKYAPELVNRFFDIATVQED